MTRPDWMMNEAEAAMWRRNLGLDPAPEAETERNRLTPGEVADLRRVTLDPEDYPGLTIDPHHTATRPWQVEVAEVLAR